MLDGETEARVLKPARRAENALPEHPGAMPAAGCPTVGVPPRAVIAALGPWAERSDQAPLRPGALRAQRVPGAPQARADAAELHFELPELAPPPGLRDSRAALVREPVAEQESG